MTLILMLLLMLMMLFIVFVDNYVDDVDVDDYSKLL